jgi:Na+/H+ antiporter NhaC
MGILFPLAVPLAVSLGQGSEPVLLGTVASVLSGSVFGDHCSPISDTTVLSSMASGSDHVDHVRTQLPYALSAAAGAILLGYLPAAVGLPVWACLPVGVAVMWLTVRFVGRPVEGAGS